MAGSQVTFSATIPLPSDGLKELDGVLFILTSASYVDGQFCVYSNGSWDSADSNKTITKIGESLVVTYDITSSYKIMVCFVPGPNH